MSRGSAACRVGRAGVRQGQGGVLVGREVEDLTDADGLALVAQGEAAQLRADVELLEADDLLRLDDARDHGALLDEHRLLLHLLARLLVDLPGDLKDDTLLRDGVHVQDGRVAGAEDGLVLEQLDHRELHLEATHGGAGECGAGREDVARLDVLVRDILKLDARVLAAHEVGDLVLVEPHVEHLDRHAVRHHPQLVTWLDRALLDLALDGGAHVLPQRRVLVALDRGQRVKGLEEGGALEPRQLVTLLEHVGRGEGGDGQVDHILLDVVAAALEEGRELLAALVEALLREVHGGVVHLVDGHHEDAHAQCLGEQGVLARLPPPLEAGLELALACGDDEHAYIGLARARDHVGHVVLVAGRVEDGVALLL
eukprot:scaffold63562_cov54-Phaeocystis_antarctica.AAC.2